VFGATATKFILDLNSNHPQMNDKSLICWDLVIICMPSMLAGKILGLMANIIFPEWMVIIIFITVMANDWIGTYRFYYGLAPQHHCGCSAPNDVQIHPANIDQN